VAEIKSTLDLVLEKTRHLTLSEEEKLSLERKELERKLQAVVNRYLDEKLSLGELKEEMEKIGKDQRGLARELLKRHLLAQFNVDADNSMVLNALREVNSFDTGQLTTLQREYEAEKEKRRNFLVQENLSALKQRGISGSAVVPNMSRVPEWDQFLKSLSKRYQERLKGIMGF